MTQLRLVNFWTKSTNCLCQSVYVVLNVIGSDFCGVFQFTDQPLQKSVSLVYWKTIDKTAQRDKQNSGVSRYRRLCHRLSTVFR